MSVSSLTLFSEEEDSLFWVSSEVLEIDESPQIKMTSANYSLNNMVYKFLVTIDGLSILYLKSSSSDATGCNTILLEVAGSDGKIFIPFEE